MKPASLRKILWLLILLPVWTAVLTAVPALGEGKVFRAEETEPFPEDARLLTLRVAGLVGGDCMLMTLGEHSMFIDVGTDNCIDKIHEVTEAAGINGVEYVYNTHPHCDHIGGFAPLTAEGFPIGTLITFFDHDYHGPSIQQRRAIKDAEEHNIPVLDLKTGDTIPFGDAELTAYRIPDERIQKKTGCNDLSGALMVRYGNCSMLLSGDIEVYGQQVLAEEYELKADVLKFPHHGAEAARKEFISEVDPECVIITQGAINSKNAQEQLRKRELKHVAFASWGMITLQTDGTKWIISQEIYPDKQRHAIEYMSYHPWLKPYP